MKTLTILLIGIVLVSCRKQEITVDVQVGHYYSVKSNVFKPGQYQPSNPVRVDSVYIDPISHLPYANILAPVDWNKFDPKQEANKIRVSNGLVIGDTSHIYWPCPQADLQ